MKRFLFVSNTVDEDGYYTTLTDISLYGAVNWNNVEHRKENKETYKWSESAEVGDYIHCWDGMLIRLRDTDSLCVKKESIKKKTIYTKIKIWWRRFCLIYENDPLKKCPAPCAHIDGMLCNSEHCSIREGWETK